MLPAWPDGTVTILVTSGQSPHAIPVSAAVRAGPRTVLIALGSGRQSLARLRAEAAVALVVLAGDNTALTAYGDGRVLKDPMPEGVVAVAIDVQSVQDHRREAFTIDAGARFHWTDEAAERRDDDVRAALGRIAESRTVADSIAAFAPGRVNLIGEHTDYNEGLALPFAITEGVTVRASARREPTISAAALDLGEEDSFAIEQPSGGEGWRAFVRGAVVELGNAGVPVVGAALEISGDIQRGAGLSSSAALEVALCLALIALSNAQPLDRVALARLCSRVENDWVGAQTGLLDQLAALFGEREHAVRIDFRSLEITPTVLELGDYKLVALDSGERHSHAGSGYNQRREECAQACERLGLASLRDATLEMADRLPAPLAGRVRHVVSENERVDQTVDALSRKDLERVGDLLNASHASLRDDYEISTPAVEKTVGRLQQAGALGARIVGGGFGGHVLGLLPPGARPPAGAVEVRAGSGARLLGADD